MSDSPDDAGPPYPPTTQALGEIPAIIPDVPINAVFLFLFLLGGAAHMTILQVNERRYHKKFGLNGAVFGFCVTRVCATTLRMAWACNPDSIRLGLAATIFFYAGVVLLFIANLFFAQRIVRAQHPDVGWTWPFTVAVPLFIAIIVATIICLIVAIIIQFYSVDPAAHQASRGIQLYGATFYLICAFVPLPVVIISTLARRHPRIRNTKTIDKFGEGSMRAKVAICLISGVLLALGAGFRAGTTWSSPVPILTDDDPPQPSPEPWYFGKAPYYCFDFAIEAFIVWFWIFTRIDKRFIVPNGAKGPHSYGNGFVFAGEAGNEKDGLGRGDSTRNLTGAEDTAYSQGPSRRSSRRSLLDNRVSWGGISRLDAHDAVGEDGIEIEPYMPLNQDASVEDPAIHGADLEMGWDVKSGRWMLRPVSKAVLRPDGGEE